MHRASLIVATTNRVVEGSSNLHPDLGTAVVDIETRLRAQGGRDLRWRVGQGRLRCTQAGGERAGLIVVNFREPDKFNPGDRDFPPQGRQSLRKEMGIDHGGPSEG